MTDFAHRKFFSDHSLCDTMQHKCRQNSLSHHSALQGIQEVVFPIAILAWMERFAWVSK